MKCPNCGQICRNNREVCALCGTPLRQKRGHGGLIALIIVLALIAAGLLGYRLFLKDRPEPEGKTPLVVEPQPAEDQPVVLSDPEPGKREDQIFENAAEVYALPSYTLALCKDGTVALAGQSASPEFGFDLFDWTRIKQVIPTDYFIAGLTEEGRVRLTGEVGGLEEAARWTDVARLYYADNSQGKGILLGLTTDGRVLAAGQESAFDPSRLSDIAELIPSADILALNGEGRVTVLPLAYKLSDAQGLYGVAEVALHADFAFYLMEDGSVRPGSGYYNYYSNNFFYSWKDMQALRVGDSYMLGLTRDGHVLGGPFRWGDPLPETGEWSDVVQLELDRERSIAYGVTGDGHVLIASLSGGESPEISAWANVKEIRINDNYVVGLTKDGRVLSWAWGEARAPLEHAGWKNVTAIALGRNHLAALTADGAVLATGDNSFGQCTPQF